MTFTQETLKCYVLTYVSIEESYVEQMMRDLKKRGVNIATETLSNVRDELAADGMISIRRDARNDASCLLCSITPAGKRYLKAFLNR